MKNELIIKIPEYLKKVDTDVEYPGNITSYESKTDSYKAFMVVVCQSNEKIAIPDNKQIIIDGMHKVLTDDQGLIEVDMGLTKKQNKYNYSIIKSKLIPSGIQYTLNMNVYMDNQVVQISTSFDEIGITGSRDSTIMSKLISDGIIIPPNMDGWFKDPYDDNYKKGILMNTSEDVKYDEMFPNHPLTILRNFVKYILDNN